MNISKTLLAAASLAALIGTTNANAYVITQSTANQNGVAFDANAAATGFNTANSITASFNYSGPLTFGDTAAQNSNSAGDLNSNFYNPADISGYTTSSTSLGAPSFAWFGGLPGVYSGLATFLASSGSASGFQYGSLITIDLGVLAAGTVLTITHDDGASVYQSGKEIGQTTVGPTSAVTESVDLTSTTDTILYYARENGTPSVLNVAVPEPFSLALLGVGMIGTGVVARRRRQSATTAA